MWESYYVGFNSICMKTEHTPKIPESKNIRRKRHNKILIETHFRSMWHENNTILAEQMPILLKKKSGHVKINHVRKNKLTASYCIFKRNYTVLGSKLQ